MRPFMAIHTPSLSDCTAPTAQPMLNTASEPWKRAGLSAPVSTITLPVMSASAMAVSTMVSVPWVTRTWRCGCAALVLRISSRSAAVISRLSLRRMGITLNSKATSSWVRISPICGAPIW